jgi:hypothetical protein
VIWIRERSCVPFKGTERGVEVFEVVAGNAINT